MTAHVSGDCISPGCPTAAVIGVRDLIGPGLCEFHGQTLDDDVLDHWLRLRFGDQWRTVTVPPTTFLGDAVGVRGPINGHVDESVLVLDDAP